MRVILLVCLRVQLGKGMSRSLGH